MVETPHKPIRLRELTPAIEFCFWVVVCLAPMLRLVNGPPVTRDQAIIQITLTSLAVLGAVALRVFNVVVKLPADPEQSPPGDQDDEHGPAETSES